MDRDSLMQGSADAFLNPSLVVSAQLLSDRAVVTRASGETALGWAVFTDGLEQYWQLARNPSAWRSARFQAEEAWVFADDREHPLSFINLCEVFGFKVDEVRSILRAWKHAHAAGLRRVLPQI
jgi:hypothetical protein